MTTGDGVDSDLVVPDSFGQCLSYEQQIAYILKLIEEIDGGVIIPEITADATVDQSTGTPSVSVVKTGTDEAPVFTFNFHNIKGETGQRGEKGETGETGATGRPGNDGADGISPTVSTAAIPNGYRITITDADGSHVFDIYNGNDGEIGPAGYSPTVTVQTITGGHSVTITDEDGDHTFNVLDGLDGIDGNDGISPEVSITSITGGHRITIVDVNGSHSFDVMDGADGQPIVPVISAQATVGSGTGTPSVSVSKSGTDEAPTYTFAFDNLKGAAGQNGQDGISPTITVTDHTTYHHIEIVSAGGTESFDVYDGTNGSDGTDGISPTVTVRSITGGHQIEIVSAGGTERFDVMDGTDGATGPAGPGLPTGGTYGQFLMKNGSADYATGWRTLNLTNSTIYKTVAGVTVPTYETNMGGQIIGAYVTLDLIDGGYDLMDPQIPLNSTLIFANGRAMRISGVDTGYRPYRIYLDYSAGWFTYLPKGGTAGQLLAKSTANDGEVEWVNAPSGDDLTLVAIFIKYLRDCIYIYKDTNGNPIIKYGGVTPIIFNGSGFGFSLTVTQIFTALMSVYNITDDNLGGFTIFDGNANLISTFSSLITLLTTNFPTIPNGTQLNHVLWDYNNAVIKTIEIQSDYIATGGNLSDSSTGYGTVVSYQQFI